MTSPPDELISLLSLVYVITRRKWLILGLMLALGLIGGAIAVLSPRKWTSSASFIAVNRRGGTTGANSLGGLAASFGVSIPVGEPSQSPAFFVDLTQTAEVLLPVLYSRSAGSPVIDAIEPERSDSAMREQQALQRLRSTLVAAASPRTGVVTVSVSTRNAQLSYDILQRVLESLDKTYGISRRTQATSERKFSEARLSEVRRQLEVAEAQQRNFLLTNKTYASSPALQLEAERLKRAVDLHQSLFVSLSQTVEQSRIEEARDTPVLSIIDRPRIAAIGAARRTILKTSVGVIAGLLLGLTWVLVAEGRRFLRESRPAREEWSM